MMWLQRRTVTTTQTHVINHHLYPIISFAFSRLPTSLVLWLQNGLQLLIFK